MKRVYVVTSSEGSADTLEILGVFATFELAEKFAGERLYSDSLDITEWDVQDK